MAQKKVGGIRVTRAISTLVDGRKHFNTTVFRKANSNVKRTNYLFVVGRINYSQLRNLAQRLIQRRLIDGARQKIIQCFLPWSCVHSRHFLLERMGRANQVSTGAGGN